MLQKDAEQPLSAPRLVNSLMNVSGYNQYSIAKLIAAGKLFNISPAAMRMAITRLTKEGLISSPERGLYQTGPKANSLKSEIGSWRYASEKTKSWTGKWIVAHTSHLGRTNKKQLRLRTRAFKIYGFAETVNGLWVRPDNLVQTLASLQNALVDIGLEIEVVLTEVSEVLEPHASQWRGLWAVDTLRKDYQTTIKVLQKSVVGIKSLSAEQAARESFLIGQSVIRKINLDPLLPTEISDARLFSTLIDNMQLYDEIGRAHWKRFFANVDLAKTTLKHLK